MKKFIDWALRSPFWVTALVCVVFYLLPFKPKPFGDGDYHIGTIQLIDYVLAGFHGNVMVNKGFLTLFCYFIPYLIAWPFKSDTAFFLSGVIFTCLFVCLAVRNLFTAFDLMHFNRKAKICVLLILCLFPVHVYYAMGIIGEGFGFFAVSVFVLYWCRIWKSDAPMPKHFAILALSLVLIYGLKPSMLPFVIVCAGYILILKMPWKPKLVFLTCMLLLPSLWMLEKKMDTSDMDFKADVFRKQILWSRFELRDEPLNWMPQHGDRKVASSDYLHNLEKRRELDSLSDATGQDPTKVYADWVKNDILSHPLLTMRQYVLKFFQSQAFIITPLMKSGKSNLVKYGIHIYINAINCILVVISLLSAVLLVRRKKYRLVLPFIFFWGWALMYVCIFHSEQRYMFIFRAAMVFLFAYWANDYFEKKAVEKTAGK